jgi:glycosyltransferase involved in cell wall biosynthesis
MNNEQPMKVLHVVGRMGCGGQETMIMNIYRKMNRSKIQFDFLVHTTEKNFYDDEIHELGGKIYSVTQKTKNIFKSMSETYRAIKKGNYQAIHVHTSSSIIAIDLFLAWCAGVKIRIAHSHSTSTERSLVHKFFSPLLNRVSTQKFACSQQAGTWLFGKSESNKLVVINNAIDSKQYEYSPDKASEIRKKLGVSDHFVLMHVGRFNTVKNHTFLIDIFEEVVKLNPDSMLVLVGDGDLKEDIRDKITHRQLNDRVKLLGLRNDIPDLMQAADVFVMPSLHEGLPVSLIEAQSSGLPCIVSDSITKETDISGLLTFVSLNEPKQKWAEMIVPFSNHTIRKNTEKSIAQSGYDIKEIAHTLENFYCSGTI